MNRQYERYRPKFYDLTDNLKRFGDTGDDLYLDNACVHAQEAVEYMLKGILTEAEVDFPQKGNTGHDIKLLMDRIIAENLFTFDRWDRLYALSKTITSWRSQGSYGLSSIKVKPQTVEEIKNIITELNEAVLISFRDKL
ncbi:MAG: HEPN domain-containing protein [Ruminiclostridium sp.]|nr:HEPN domain-containing protein [Ruminiclostridium sp.]